MQKKLLFEMCEKHVQTVAEMIVIKESYSDILQLRYADVLLDGKVTPYDTAFGNWRHVKLCKREAYQIMWKNSLCEGLESHLERDGSMSLDVLSGAFMRWDKELSCTVDSIYTHEFGDALNSLEYKKNYEWVSRAHLDPVSFNLQEVDEEHPTDLQ